MRLDLQKLDDRIKKLQEIRRMLSDPEMASMLMELVSPDDSRPAPVEMVAAQEAGAPQDADVTEILKEVAAGDSQASGGLWGIRRK